MTLFQSYFMYDYPNLFLFSACFLFLYQRKWTLFYVLFALTCFSKETAILLPFVFFLNRREPQFRNRFWRHFFGQSAIWVIITIFLRYVFRHNPGQLVEFQLLKRNIPIVLDPASYFQFDALLLPRDLNLLLIALLAVLVCRNWKKKPLFMRKSLAILIPLVGLGFFFGIIDEMRIYYEVVPIVFMLCLPTIQQIYKVRYGTDDLEAGAGLECL